ncbi:IQ domain-containing protein C [Trichomycterus rosablanca]|uniref:IQ domain-containing protein C n=1 Tax=Trichomycterus rosablanca TaxID=2290929 RepID=UPI002F352D4D
MERQQWITDIMYFQARCRGYLYRDKLKSIQSEYEAVVKELEGSVDHLSWTGHFIPKPHFSNPDRAFFKYRRLKSQTQGCPEVTEEVKIPGEGSTLCSLDLVPERDEEPSCSRESECRLNIAPEGGDTERTKKQCGSETAHVLNCVSPEISNRLLQKGLLMCSVLTDVAHTPEALQQHRNTLAMELLWIQQAIASRKKYLMLKQKMEKV